MKPVRANPLLDPDIAARGVPPFDLIETEDYLPALKHAIAEREKQVAKIASNPEEPTFENTVLALERSAEPFQWVVSIFAGVMHAHATEGIHELAQDFFPTLSDHENEVILNTALFERLALLRERASDQQLDREQLRLLELRYQAARDNGATLDDEAKQRLTAIGSELASLGALFGRNVLESTNSFDHHAEDESEVEGLPRATLSAARAAAEARGRTTGWTFTLQQTNRTAVATHARNRGLRERMMRAGSSIACGGASGNEATVKSIAALHLENARLLGSTSYLEHALVERMAESEDDVHAFVESFIEMALPVARAELADLQALALELDGIEELRPWDVIYYRNELKKRTLSLDEEQLRIYFEFEHVLEAVFSLVRRLHGCAFTRRHDVPTYHEDVRVYELKAEGGEPLGLLFLDLFPRESKSPGAWMNVWRTSGQFSHGDGRAVVGVTASLTPPGEDGASFLLMREVRTLLHEFGHALHALLSRCQQPALAGTRVYRDFVELPSQLMENWAWSKEGLQLLGRHRQTGEPLTDQLIDAIGAGRSFHAGMLTLSQAALELLDLAWFGRDADQVEDVLTFEREATERVRLFKPLDGACMSCAFKHIFAGGYSAAYYSYRWSRMLDADAFSRFEEEGIFSKDVARAFREEILEKGNSAEPAELFEAFRGRPARPDALLNRLDFVVSGSARKPQPT